MFQNLREFAGRCHAWGGGRRSRYVAACGRERRLLRAAALGALASSGALTGVDAAWGQISETLPEVTVSAPRPKPRPPRRAEPAPRRTASSAPAPREPAPAAPETAPGHCAVPISVRRSDAHHRSRHRPQQGAGDGADAPRRGLLARLFA